MWPVVGAMPPMHPFTKPCQWQSLCQKLQKTLLQQFKLLLILAYLFCLVVVAPVNAVRQQVLHW